MNSVVNSRSAARVKPAVRLPRGLALRVPNGRAVLLAVLPPLLGLALLVLIWQGIAANNSSFPSHAVTWDVEVRMCEDRV
jgi:nitrate/nitrite transport system permease protein